MIHIKYLLLAFSFLYLSCSPRLNRALTDDNLMIFPAPPDTTRIQYLTSFSNSLDVTGRRSGFSEFILGKAEGKPITKPYGISVHKGKIYICDTMFGGLEIIDLENKTFDYFEPGGRGQLKKPINCFVDSEGCLYVADSERKEIVVFDEALQYISSIGDPNTMKPTDVFVRDGFVWVSDMKGHKIHVYSKKGYKLLKSFPDANQGDEEFLNSPINIFVDEKYIYVSDFGAFKIKRYSLDGEYDKSVGSYGRSLGQFARPKGIAVDKNSLLYVVDAGFENVQIFNPEGKLMMFFGGKYERPGNMWLPAKVVIDYENLEYFKKYLHQDYNLKYLVFVTNQYGPDKINVYGFVELKNKN